MVLFSVGMNVRTKVAFIQPSLNLSTEEIGLEAVELGGGGGLK